MSSGPTEEDPSQPLVPESSKVKLKRGACCGCDWSIAEAGDVTSDGTVRTLSKGGSPHVTDDVFNTAMHFVGLMLSILGTACLIAAASVQAKPWHILSFSIYGATLIGLFTASTLHHGINSTPYVEKVLLLVDYIAIFPLIAGTFTPFCLVYLHDSWIGWTFFGCSWGIALFGVIMIALLQEKLPRWVNFTMYMTIGWFGLLLCLLAWDLIGVPAICLIATGGVLYTGGGVVFMAEKPNPAPGTFGFHEIWHIFVFLGAMVHWFVMYLYVLPHE